MVVLDLKVTIDEFIANTDSVISIFLDDNLIGYLDRNTRTLEQHASIQSDTIKIVIKRQYKEFDFPRKTGLVKRVVSSFLSFLLLAGSTTEPFECPYECSETVYLTLDGACPGINIMCSQEDDNCPRFFMEYNQCTVTTSKAFTISKTELDSYYRERRKQVLAMMCLSMGMLAVIFVPALFFLSQTTIVFSLILFGLVLICTLFSLKNLKRKYLGILNTII